MEGKKQVTDGHKRMERQQSGMEGSSVSLGRVLEKLWPESMQNKTKQVGHG